MRRKRTFIPSLPSHKSILLNSNAFRLDRLYNDYLKNTTKGEIECEGNEPSIFARYAFRSSPNSHMVDSEFQYLETIEISNLYKANDLHTMNWIFLTRFADIELL